MKNRYYVCKYFRWHLRGIRCECGTKPIYWSERKCH